MQHFKFIIDCADSSLHPLSSPKKWEYQSPRRKPAPVSVTSFVHPNRFAPLAGRFDDQQKSHIEPRLIRQPKRLAKCIPIVPPVKKPVSNCYHVSALYDFRIPALSAMKIKVNISALSPDQNTSLSSSCLGILSGKSADGAIIIQEGLVSVRNVFLRPDGLKSGSAHIYIINSSSSPILFKKGYTIAEFLQLPKGTLLSSLDNVLDVHSLSSSTVRKSRMSPADKKAFLATTCKLDCPSPMKPHYLSLISRFHDIFSDNDTDIGFSAAVPHHVRMKTKEPIYRKQFPVPWSQRHFVQSEIEKMLKQGVIEHTRSFYNSPVFCVAKPHTNGQKLRMVIDYRMINSNAYADYWSMSDVSECLTRVGANGSNVFSATDLTAGYHQAELHIDSRDPTAFTFGDKSYRFTRIPFGLSGAPATFSRLMNKVCDGLPNSLVYLDDVITHSRGHMQHLMHLERYFTRLRQFGLKLSPRKCTFGASSVTYLGYKISAAGVEAGDEKLNAVKNFPPPSNIRQIRQFCGLANYFRHLIPNFSRLSNALSVLTKKDNDWSGGRLPPHALRAFDSLKKALSSAPVVAFPNPKKPFMVDTDASLGDKFNPGGLGAVLSQNGPDGKPRVVAYASRALKDSERNYSSFLLEMQAVVFAIEHWHSYLYGNKFSVHVDCRPLTHLNTLHRKTLYRLQELMSRYNFTLSYKSGANNGPADCLSRNPVDALGTDVSVPELQAEDNFCKEMKAYLRSGVLPQKESSAKYILLHAPVCFLTDNNILMRKFKESHQLERDVVVVPADLRLALIVNNHSDFAAGHMGIAKTVSRLQLNYWWPGMFYEVEKFIKSCDLCQRVRNPANFISQTAPLSPLRIPPTIHHTIHIDLICPPKADGVNKYILIVVDGYSKYMSLYPLPSKDMHTVATCLYDNYFSVHGFPNTLISDQGKEFCNQILNEMCNILQVKKLRTSAYHPASNSACENKIALVNRMLAGLMKHPADGWAVWLPAITLSYNSSVSDSTKCSPFFLTFGVEAKLPELPEIEPLTPCYGQDPVADRLQRLQEARVLAKNCLARAQELNRRYYDKPSSKVVSFIPGERVLLMMPRSTVRTGNPKFAKPWIPAVVLLKISNLSYIVKKLETASNRTTVVHCNRLKKYYPLSIMSENSLRQLISRSDIFVPTSAKFRPNFSPPPTSHCDRASRTENTGSQDVDPSDPSLDFSFPETLARAAATLRQLPPTPGPRPGPRPQQPEAGPQRGQAQPRGGQDQRRVPGRPPRRVQGPAQGPAPRAPQPGGQALLGRQLFAGVLRRGRSGGPVEDIPLPDRAAEYKPYAPRRRPEEQVPVDEREPVEDPDIPVRPEEQDEPAPVIDDP